MSAGQRSKRADGERFETCCNSEARRSLAGLPLHRPNRAKVSIAPRQLASLNPATLQDPAAQSFDLADGQGGSESWRGVRPVPRSRLAYSGAGFEFFSRPRFAHKCRTIRPPVAAGSNARIATRKAPTSSARSSEMARCSASACAIRAKAGSSRSKERSELLLSITPL